MFKTHSKGGDYSPYSCTHVSCRDWRGVAEFMGCDALTVQNLERQPNPFATLILQNLGNFLVSDLITVLQKMDRYDVVDDTLPLIGTLYSVLYLKKNPRSNLCLISSRK